MSDSTTASSEVSASVKRYSRYLLIIAGLGGLIYGLDVGIIAGALPFLKATAGNYLKDANLGLVVAAVLGGSVISSLFAGALADMFGRKKMLIISSLLFVVSIPIIACTYFSGEVWTLWGYEVSSGFLQLCIGRIIQGFSAGLIGVIVPLYLAECLSADSRGKGTGMFQLMLTIGLVLAAFIAYGFSWAVENWNLHQDTAWRGIFWVSIIPGVLLSIGALFVTESPRWLFKRNRKEEALAALRRGNSEKVAVQTLEEIEATAAEAKAQAQASSGKKETLFQKKYVYPFILAVVILACTQATGINSMLNYSVSIFHQGGLEGTSANAGDIALKVANMVMTIVAVALVDKMGRKFLLRIGTSGIIVGLCFIGFLFLSIEQSRVSVKDPVSTMIVDKHLDVDLNSPAVLTKLGLDPSGDNSNKQLVVNYEQGGAQNSLVFNFAKVMKDGEESPAMATIPMASPDKNGDIAGIKILSADLGDRPSQTVAWMIVVGFVIFISFYGVGPGVCVWLALSELMPTRIRSNGMSIALLINQGVSTTIAMFFLPWVAAIGYSSVFFMLAGFTVIYFITVNFFLPETKGRTLEEIETYFTTGKMPTNEKELEEDELKA